MHPDLDQDLGLDLDLDLVGRGVTGLGGRVVVRRAVLRLVVLRLVDLRLTGLGDRVVVRRAVLRRVVLRLVVLRRAVTGLGDRVVVRRVVLRQGVLLLVGRGVTGLGGRRVLRLVGLAILDRAVPVDLVGPVDRGLQDLTDRVGLVGLAARVDRHRLRTGPRVPTTGVTPKWAAPMTRRMASAHPTMARRLRLHNTGSAGMTDPLPEALRLTGPGRRLRVAGTVLRLPAVGTLDGMGRHAT
jgi:hypothetical protein